MKRLPASPPSMAYDRQVAAILPADLYGRFEASRALQPDETKAEAVRRLLGAGLAAEQSARQEAK